MSFETAKIGAAGGHRDVQAMPAILDLNGASGATYRFRLAPDGYVRMPLAGNHVCVRAEESGFTVLSVTATNDPFTTGRAWRHAVARRGATHLYTRLNVSASVREAEQRDIAAYYRPRAGRR
jgi:hypothetical protein